MMEISKKIFSTFVSCVILFFPNKLFKKINALNQINLEIIIKKAWNLMIKQSCCLKYTVISPAGTER